MQCAIVPDDPGRNLAIGFPFFSNSLRTCSEAQVSDSRADQTKLIRPDVSDPSPALWFATRRDPLTTSGITAERRESGKIACIRSANHTAQTSRPYYEVIVVQDSLARQVPDHNAKSSELFTRTRMAQVLQRHVVTASRSRGREAEAHGGDISQ